MEQIIPDNENIEDYFTGDEIDEWEDLDEWEFETLGELRSALNRWVDNIYEKGYQKILRCNIPQLRVNYISRCTTFL